ncbi:MAG: hypothetical protein ACK42D_01060 [Candidatus Paceibacteria bacterium]
MPNNLQFNDPTVNSIASRRPKIKKKTFSDRLINAGLAKDEAQANLYLIGFIVIAFALIIYINMKTFSSPAPAAITDDEMDEMMDI